MPLSTQDAALRLSQKNLPLVIEINLSHTASRLGPFLFQHQMPADEMRMLLNKTHQKLGMCAGVRSLAKQVHL